MIGGITNTGVIYTEVVDSTRSDIVVNFFLNLHTMYNLKGAVVVLDNHRAHISNIVKNCANSIGFELLFLPPVTGFFNPIETYWALVKHHWRKKLMATDTERQTVPWMKRQLQLICESIPDNQIQNLS